MADEDIIKLQLEQQRREYQDRIQAEQEQQELEKPGPEKMGVMFFGIMLFLCVVGDLIDIFTAGTIGWLIGLFIDAILLIATGLSKSGRKQFRRILIGALGDSVPLIAVFPFRSLFLTWAFMRSRSEYVEHLAKMAEKIKNKRGLLSKIAA